MKLRPSDLQNLDNALVGSTSLVALKLGSGDLWGGSVSLTAPTLTWDTASSDNTPQFTVTFVSTPEVGDTVEFQIDDDPAFGSTSDTSDTVDAGEVAANDVVLTLAALSDGTYYTRARHVRGATVSDWSSTVTVTIDATAPTLSSASGTQTGQTTATLSVTTDEANGTLYAFVSTSSTPPSATDLKAGTGAVYASSQAVASTGAKTFSATGLTAGTTYYAHFLHRDTAGNESSIATSASFTTTAAAGGNETETDALIARMSVAPDSTREGHINTLIASLKSAGVWTKLEGFYIFAAHNQQAATLNWLGNTHNMTENGTVNFVADSGYQGNGTNFYLTPGFTLNTMTKALQDDVMFAFGIPSGLGGSAGYPVGTPGSSPMVYAQAGASNMAIRVMNSATVASFSGGNTGRFLGNRVSSAEFVGAKNGTEQTFTQASQTRSSQVIALFQAAGIYYTGRMSFFAIGGGLTSGERTAFDSAISTYLTAVGAA